LRLLLLGDCGFELRFQGFDLFLLPCTGGLDEEEQKFGAI
jgi:hypothetical protein